jgi:hypothetical protein
VRSGAIALASVIAALGAAGCDATAPTGDRSASPTGPTPTPISSTTAEPKPTVAWSPEPNIRTYVPENTPPPIQFPLVTIDGGAMLSHDRRSVAISFIGGPAYDPANWCSVEYHPWAAIRGDALEVAVAAITPADRATMPPNGACVAMGYSYTFTLAQPASFIGSTVRDLASGELWIPPPERVAEPGPLLPGWRLTAIRTMHLPRDGVDELVRTYGPIPGAATDPNAVMFLVQQFGSPPDDAQGAPVADVEIDGQRVTVRDSGGGGLSATWQVGAADWVTLNLYGVGVDLDAFVDRANAVAVPGS